MDNQLLKSAFERTRIVGADVSEYPLTPDMSALDHHVLAIRKALADAGLKLTDVDGLIMAGGGGPGGMSPMGLAEYLGLRPTYVDGLSVGGSSFVYHAARAALAVGTGLCEVAVVAMGQTGKSGSRAPRGMRAGGASVCG
ncbi:MAG: hypothetical protein WD826_12805 [Actinomycetota bacterium]